VNHRAILALLLCACGQQASNPIGQATVPIETPSCAVAFAPTGGIAELVESAAEQWSEATGCDVHIADDGIPVSYVTRILDARGNPQCGETHRLRDETGSVIGVDFIHISTNIADRCHLPERDVLHEMGHGLAPHRGHAADGLMAATWNAIDYVDEIARAFVCAELAC
jgi:hypothetical protein